jgi:ribosomal protein S18 acetylase RimI-like enzyme
MKFLDLFEIRLSSPNNAKAVAALQDMTKDMFRVANQFYVMNVGDATVSFELYPFDGKVRLAHIRVPPQFRGQGIAQKALQHLAAIADQHQVEISAEVKPTDPGVKKAGLHRLYRRFGFERQPYHMQPDKLSDMILRRPR